VKGQIGSSGFMAEVPIYENQTFEFERIIELAVTGLDDRSVVLGFNVTSLIGNFGLLKRFELKVCSNSEEVELVRVENEFVNCAQASISLEPGNTLFLNVNCTGIAALTSAATISLSFTAFSSEYGLQHSINILLKTSQ